MSRLLKGTLVGGGIVAAGYLLYKKFKHTGSELEIEHQAAIQEVGINGVKIRLDVVLKNPTATGFTIKFPFLRLLYNKDVVGSSEVINRDIKIRGYGEAKIGNILIHIPAINLLSSGYKLFKDLKAKKKITVGIKTTTLLLAGGIKIPFETNEVVNIEQQKK